ncbi:sugar-binding cellulase-like protein [Rathayibacter sp. PhB93]|uniref:cellulase-like family protein n=1 Tax=unclassified Rathayibacter TaxID=2609250 RepID=UPI000F49827A|nr:MULTISPECIES: cellulase-like family protein [unclassified Rathayibacter]ROQ04560.1 sugar-binding cellulase-like protein [Rathayibacter sp. PhB93]TDQ13398.1 sugar-binding cellulase-like protein [Rathayibacter sp. PhB1]
MTRTPVRPPAHLPPRLTLSLWDFSWYTRTMPGEPFHDLGRAFDEAVERGCNTVRICAAPLLLFGDHSIDTSQLRFSNMGGDVGRGTRWYDAVGGAVLDLRARLVELFRQAAAHDVLVIVSSWEYQQSPAFLSDSSWHDMLTAIPPTERHEALARAESRLIAFLEAEGLADRIAYVEVHNEVDLSRLGEVPAEGLDTFWAQKPYLTAALEILQAEHPDVLSTVCYGIPPYLDLDSVPENAQVAHVHFYVYGVLAALEEWAGVRAEPPVFPSAELRSLLREGAPEFDALAHTVEPWRLAATGISPSMFYAYDRVDPVAWDAWLYSHYGRYEVAMREAIDVRLRAVAIWALRRGIPAVVGEGWIGYTPLEAEFEDGPAGQVLAGYAVQRCIDLGYWGTLVGSNSAPQHPGWSNVELQRRLNGLVLASGETGETGPATLSSAPLGSAPLGSAPLGSAPLSSASGTRAESGRGSA